MIKERADLLVAALRSGKYEQVRGVLRREGGFCCLGVACDISGLDTWNSTDKIADSIQQNNVYTYLGERGILPEAVQKYFGFKSNNGAWGSNNALSQMNDRGASFTSIADFIEQNWEQL